MASKKKGGARIKLTLVCSECKRKNYTTMKNKRNSTGKLVLKKYCSFDRKHTVHKEGKI